jgi:DNA (cytosine-5)-methyltransferase 1
VNLAGLKAVELFAGIGGFRLAADSCGIKTIWANDLDSKACLIYRSRFGRNEIQEGDIRSFTESIPTHQLLTAGFPCQPFSSAGKKEGIRDPRGTLFHEIVSAIKRHRPDCFVLENVKRLLQMEDGCHFATVLSALADLDYQIEWRLLNAMNLGLPQNRQRVIILGISKHLTASSFYDLSQIRLAPTEDFPQVCDRDLERVHRESKWSLITKHEKSFPSWGIAYDSKFVGLDLETFTHASPPVRLCNVLEQNPASEFDFTESTLQRLSENSEVNRYVGGVEIISNQGGGARMGYTIFGIEGIAPTLTAATSRHYERYKINGRYRRLTNIEYARIQGFPDDHCKEVSVYDQYGLYGNAIPPPMVKWVFGRLHVVGTTPPVPNSKQLELKELVHE